MKMWNRIFRSKSSKDNNIKRKKRIIVLEEDIVDEDKKSSTKVDSDNEDIIYAGAGPEDVELKPCPVCSRTFVPSALEKHVAICEKMAIQKRMPFDSFRQRRRGTEPTLYLSSTNGSTTKTKSSKQQANSSSVSSTHESEQGISDKTQQVSAKFNSYKAETPLMTRSLKRTLGPINEVCPHCGRSFGTKAYDRHVEWCKEKSKITSHTLSAQNHLAKERMQARTKYKAPMLRSKREKNREKYSSLSESMNNLSDSGDVSIVDFNSVADPFERARKSSLMSISVSSSIASDCPISSNKYDPFVSAKRQFDDLFSTDPSITSTPLKGIEPLANNSLSSPSQAKNLSITKSSFRRTSSLRAPKKTPSVSFVPKYKPNIQRGISDEGPISTNFIKPEEFDELPVKSHAIVPPDLVPKVNSKKQLNRGNSSVLEIFGRESSKICKGNSPESHNKMNDFNLTETDSLAAFLKFENDLKYPILIERAPRNQPPKNMFIDSMNAFEENENSTPRRIQDSAVNLLLIERPLKKNKILFDPKGETTEFNNNNIKVDSESTEFCVSNLSNSCDNLEISDSTGRLKRFSNSKQQQNGRALGTEIHSTLKISSSTESIDSHRNMENIVNLRNITDSEIRNPKRQLRFQKDNLLFDNPQYEEKLKNNIDTCRNVFAEYIPNNSVKTIPKINQQGTVNKRQNHESMFDNFNLEEFISSFSDNEQFPIFKNYKESMRPMTLNIESPNEDHFEKYLDKNIQSESNNETEHETFAEKQSENSIERFSVDNILKKPDVTVEAEERMKLETGVTQLSLNREKLLRDINVEQDRALIERVQNLKLMCNANTDEPDSISSNQRTLYNPAYKTNELCQRSFQKSSVHSYQMPEFIGILPENLRNKLSSIQSSPLEEVTEVPESNEIMTKQISTAITLHKNDSQNIYNTMNMTRNSYLNGPELSLGPCSFSEKGTKLSKFCHECGVKFIVDQAKFCMECGVRRVTID